LHDNQYFVTSNSLSLAEQTRSNRSPANEPARGADCRPAPSSGRHLDSLTPLRGIAALWVVVFHYMFQYFSGLDVGAYTHLVGKGYLAVDLFFMLSGFVMTHVYHAAFKDGVGDNYWDFLKARVARLYPMHLFVLLLFLVAALASQAAQYAAPRPVEPLPLEGARSIVALFANLFMLQGLHASALSWNYPAWSISLEFMAYLAFPLMLYAFWGANAVRKLALAGVLASALAALAYLTKDDFNQWDGPASLLRCLPEFMLGMLLYSLFRSGALQSWLSSDRVAFGAITITILLLHIGAPDLLMIPLMAVLMLAAVMNHSKFAALLNIAPLVWLGEISYSLYLLHDLVQHITTMVLRQGFGIDDAGRLPPWPSLALMLAMIGACLLAAALTYRWIEVPARGYLRSVFEARRPETSSRLRPARRPGPAPALVSPQTGWRRRSAPTSNEGYSRVAGNPTAPGPLLQSGSFSRRRTPQSARTPLMSAATKNRALSSS
jgi:peptidoglycan/LPS O-acetylase OafA/YrhL